MEPDKQEMTPDQAIEFYTKLNNLIKDASKPKDEKKPDTKDKLDVVDRFLIFQTLFNCTIIIITCWGLHELTAFMKAIPH